MMQLDILRRQTPERVRQELWTGLLAYNLVRQSILQSAQASTHLPRQLSFAATLQMLANGWLVGAILPPTAQTRGNLAMLRMASGSSHIVANRQVDRNTRRSQSAGDFGVHRLESGRSGSRGDSREIPAHLCQITS